MRLWPFGKVEKRDIQFSPQFSVMLSNIGSGMGSTAGTAVNSDTALRLMAVWGCVRVIAEDLASLPLHIYRRLQPRGKERVPGHPLYDVLHSAPNELQTSFQFRETMMAHLLIWGNAFAEIQLANGRAVGLWPISPTRVNIRRNYRTGALEYFITPINGGQQLVLSRRQVLHIPGLSTDGIIGLTPLTVAREAIGLGLAHQEFSSRFFVNGARPSGVLEHPGQLSSEAMSRLRAEWETVYTGLSNAQRVAILEEGMKYSTVGMPLEDAQFLEQRRFSVEEICRLYRVQPHKVMVTQGSMSYASVEQSNIAHVVDCIRPWLVRWEQAILSQLIPAEEQGEFFAEFLVDGLLRGDSEARSKFYKAMWEIGCLSPNDIRELENMSPVEGGDLYYTPLNFAPVGSTTEEKPAMTPVQAPQNGRVGVKSASS